MLLSRSLLLLLVAAAVSACQTAPALRTSENTQIRMAVVDSAPQPARDSDNNPAR